VRTVILFVAVVGLAAIVDGQTNSARITANVVEIGGRVINTEVQGTPSRRFDNERIVTLRGDVIVTTEAAVIHANEAVFYPKTNRAELRGNVTVQLVTPPAISK
jgi:lipopolysaccharide assembly outer membrane protein LptD (OstA)